MIAYQGQLRNIWKMTMMHYIQKICNSKENKLKEFYFKIIHGILPCNVNLARWRIRISNLCDVCGEKQDIKHLLFDCAYVKTLWEVIEDIVEAKIMYKNIILGIDGTTNLPFKNYVIDFCAFAIYKEWLLHSLEGKTRPKTCNLKREQMIAHMNIQFCVSNCFPFPLDFMSSTTFEVPLKSNNHAQKQIFSLTHYNKKNFKKT